MAVRHVKLYELDKVWQEAEKYIASALEHGLGEMTTEQARYAVVKQMAELFITNEDEKITGAVLVEFINYPNYRIANVVAIGGRGMIKDWDSFKELLRMGGASYIEGHCYDSISRLWESKLGMKKAYTIMRSAL